MQKEGSRQDYDIVGSYDNQRITTINAERTVNLFEYIDPQGKRPKVLLPTAGLVDAGLNFGSETGGSRAAFVFNNPRVSQEMYLVYGSSVFRVTGSTDALSITHIGDFTVLVNNVPEVTTTTGYVGVDANQYQIIFVDGVAGWIWDTIAETWTQITDTGFPAKPIDVCYLDGFFVVANGGTNTFQLSQINQGMVWSGSTSTFSTTASPTNQLTLNTNTANFATGVPVTLSTNTPAPATITAVNTGTEVLTLNMSNENFQTGTSLRFSSTATLPNPLAAGTTYYSIMQGLPSDNPGMIKVATTYANAIAGIAINITTTGSGTNTVTATSILPTPLIAGTTYYVIRVGNATGNTIQLATSYENAIAGIAITLTDTGSPMNNITVTGQLQLGSITSHPGTIVACNTLHRRLFLFSQNYTEVWENAGLGTNLPFRRNNSLLMEVGTPAIASVKVGFDRMFFLAQDQDGLAGVMEVRGTESILVSNRALDYQLAQYALTPGLGVDDAWGILIKENGLIFYRLNFTKANHTYVLGVTMSTQEAVKWHEEETLEFNRHPAQTHAYFGGTNYYGDYAHPLLYEVDDTVSTNNHEAIRRMRIGRQMTPSGYNRLRIDRFQLDLLQGAEDLEFPGSFVDVDLLTEDQIDITTESEIDIILETQIEVPSIFNGGNPEVFLSVSRDGGQTYGNHLIAKMGKIGERTYRTVWRKIGTTPRGQGFVPKIEFYNEIPFVVLGAAWDFEDMPE